MNQESYEYQIGMSNQQLTDHERRIVILESHTETQKEMAYLLREQQEMNKRQEKQHEKTNEVLGEMSRNLQSLNHDFREVKDDVVGIHGRVGELENQNVNRLFDWDKFWKDFFNKFIPTVVAALVVAFLVYYLGWK